MREKYVGPARLATRRCGKIPHLSPRRDLRDFAGLNDTVHFPVSSVLIIDLFPPSPRDPSGLHKLIWDEIEEEDFEFPPGKDRLLVSDETGEERVADIEPVTVGDTLPEMPLFLTNSLDIRVPLEDTYQATGEALPEELQMAVETDQMPDPDPE